MAFNDPLPHIKPALLNSADIQAYQEACEILKGETIDPHSDRLKASTYKILCAGDIFWRDEHEGRQTKRIDKGTAFKIPRNGIVFISPQVEFNLPDYIAARFNLTISLVHQGLLLGTGPMVDPGYKGRLLIPLHNLTTRDVTLTGESGLIWVEFTKISTDTTQIANGKTFGFVHSSRNIPERPKMEDYFSGTGGVPVRSTLHDNAARWEGALKSVRSVQKSGEKLQNYLNLFGWAGAIILFLTVAALIYTMYQTYGSFISLVQQSQAQSAELQLNVEKLSNRIAELEKQSSSRKRSGGTTPALSGEGK